MTRKQYTRRIQELVTAIYKQPGFKSERKNQLGISLKYARDHVKEVPAVMGSYQNAWDNLKPAREFYGVK